MDKISNYNQRQRSSKRRFLGFIIPLQNWKIFGTIFCLSLVIGVISLLILINPIQKSKKELPEGLPKIKIKDNSLVIPQLQKDFSIDEIPTFVIEEPRLTIDELISSGKAEIVKGTFQNQGGAFFEKLREDIIRKFIEEARAQVNEIEAQILGPDRKKLDTLPEITPSFKDDKEAFKVKIPRPKAAFKPGLYKLEVEFETEEAVFLVEQDFRWGALAINTNKSIYLPDERAYLQMAVLGDDGHTICDANLKLEMISPSGRSYLPEIQRSGECGPDNVTDKPDYFAYYQVGEPGIYQMKLTNLDTGYKIEDSFEVRESAPFEVERIGPTRIYPPVPYKMTLKIKTNQDFIGEIIETVPRSFEISETGSPSAQVGEVNETKEIVWQVNWKAGETHELEYQFDAPDISPYLFLLGPLKLATSDEKQEIRFKELRSWQMAADATDSVTAACEVTGGSCSCWAEGTSCTLECWDSTCTAGCPAAPANSTYSSDNCADGTDGCGYCDSGSCTAPGRVGCSCTASGTCTYTCNSGYGNCDADDSNGCETALITISGNAYEDEATTALAACDGSTDMIALRMGGTTYLAPCADADGAFSFSDLCPPAAGDPIVIWIDGVTDTFGSNVNRYSGSGDITGIAVRRNRVIVRHDDAGPITNTDMDTYDNDDDTDINYYVDGTNSLRVEAGSKLIINSNDTFTPGGDVYILADPNGDLLVMSGATLSGTNDIYVHGGDVTGDGTINLTGGTFQVDTNSGDFGGNTDWTFYDLRIGDGSNTCTTTATGTGGITVTNSLVIDQYQTLNAGSKTWTLSGTGGVPFAINGTFNGETSTFVYSGDNASGDTTIAASVNYYNLQINNASETYTLYGATTLSGDFTATAGTLSEASQNLTVNGGDITGDGTINFTGGTVTLDGAGNFGGATDWTFYNLTIGGDANAETTTATGTGGITVTNILTIGANQTLDAGSKTWTLSNSGTPFVINGSFTASTSTLKYTASAATNITATTYNNLELLPSADAITFTLASGTITTNGYLTIGNGTNTGTIDADTNDPTLDIDGNFTISANATFTASATGTFTVAGDWSNSGTFTHSNGTVTFDGTSQQTLSGTMTGSSAFYNLTITNNSGTDPDTDPSVIFSAAAEANTATFTTASTKLRFNAGSTYTFTNINFNGQADTTRITLRSSSAGTQWSLVVTGTQTVSNTDAKDSDASGGDIINATDGTNYDSGNNINWSFALPVASSVSIDSGATSIDLSEGTTKNVVCTATVTDTDGYTQITSVEAKLYRTGVGAGAVDDNANHYTLSGDTECVPSNGSGTTEDYTCTFAVYFYADPTDVGSTYETDDWTCQVTPSDGAGVGTADTDTIEMDTLIALDVTATINYGTLALGADTGTTDQTTTVTNTGNAQIDIQLDGYGATDGDGYSMTCTIGTIPIGNERYSLTAATDWSTKTQLTDTATTLTAFDLAKGASSTKDVYWGFGLPSTGVGGSCSGKVNFTAVSG